MSFMYAEKEPYLATSAMDSCWQTWPGQLADQEGEWDYTMVQRLHHWQTGSHGTKGWKDASEDNKWMIAPWVTFSKSLNPRNIDKSALDIRIRLPFESSFWISVSGWKLTILPDIQPENRRVIISAWYSGTDYVVEVFGLWFSWVRIQSCFANFESESNPDPVPTTMQAIRLLFASG